MSTERRGQWATSHRAPAQLRAAPDHASLAEAPDPSPLRAAAGPAPVRAAPDPAPAAEVIEFIRFCYQRRGIGWPELYDEMCAVAARGLFRGLDYDRLAVLGVGFCLEELPRLATLARQVVAEERSARWTPPDGVQETLPARLSTAPAMG